MLDPLGLTSGSWQKTSLETMTRKLKKPQRNLRDSRQPHWVVRTRRALSNIQLVFVFLCIAAAVSIVLHFSVDKFPDPDVFYHFRHAELYASTSEIFRTDFPWVHYSVISKLSSDLWYGFHVVLIPFTLVGDRILGMQLAGAVCYDCVFDFILCSLHSP